MCTSKKGRAGKNVQLLSISHFCSARLRKIRIVVSLELGEFRILKQHLQEDRCIEVEVIAKTYRVRCPHCWRVSVKVHDTRPPPKRDIQLRGHRIVLVLPNQPSLVAHVAPAFPTPI